MSETNAARSDVAQQRALSVLLVTAACRAAEQPWTDQQQEQLSLGVDSVHAIDHQAHLARQYADGVGHLRAWQPQRP